MTKISGKRWLDTPRNLLLLDSLGALATFSFTAFLLAPSWIPTGLPGRALVILSLVAFGYFLTGQYGLLFQGNHRLMLRILAVLNSVYGLTTIGLCAIHRTTLTLWGGIYFTFEVLILIILVRMEWRLSQATPDIQETQDA